MSRFVRTSDLLVGVQESGIWVVPRERIAFVPYGRELFYFYYYVLEEDNDGSKQKNILYHDTDLLSKR